MDSNLRIIIDRLACPKHKVPVGIPCWHVHSSRGPISPAVCNKRAVKAGFNGKIHPSSLRKKGQKS